MAAVASSAYREIQRMARPPLSEGKSSQQDAVPVCLGCYHGGSLTATTNAEEAVEEAGCVHLPIDMLTLLSILSWTIPRAPFREGSWKSTV